MLAIESGPGGVRLSGSRQRVLEGSIMRRHSSGRLTLWSGFLVGVALSMSTQACEEDNPALNAVALPADTIQCTSTTDRGEAGGLGVGLVVRFTLPVDAAGPYFVQGQIYQDWRRGPVSYANDRGVDMSRMALPKAHAIRVYAAGAGDLEVTLWFPGSELRARAQGGPAWVDVQVSDTTRAAPPGSTEARPSPRHFYRCRIARIEPREFMSRLPGQGPVPPLPKPVSK